MAYEKTERTSRSTRTWSLNTVVVAGLLVGLIGVPAVIIAEVEFGALTAVGLGGAATFGAVAIAPGFLLGALSLLTMLGS